MAELIEQDSAYVDCTEGGTRHRVDVPPLGVDRLVCPGCRRVFVRDGSWAQGWRPLPLGGLRRLDPPGCGCTDCLTGYSRPWDLASDEEKEALRRGELRDATAGASDAT